MITPGCFVNYQLNQSCYCDYNSVCLLDNWREKDLENKRGNQLKFGMKKIVHTNTPWGINITKL